MMIWQEETVGSREGTSQEAGLGQTQANGEGCILPNVPSGEGSFPS